MYVVATVSQSTRIDVVLQLNPLVQLKHLEPWCSFAQPGENGMLTYEDRRAEFCLRIPLCKR